MLFHILNKLCNATFCKNRDATTALRFFLFHSVFGVTFFCIVQRQKPWRFTNKYGTKNTTEDGWIINNNNNSLEEERATKQQFPFVVFLLANLPTLPATRPPSFRSVRINGHMCVSLCASFYVANSFWLLVFFIYYFSFLHKGLFSQIDATKIRIQHTSHLQAHCILCVCACVCLCDFFFHTLCPVNREYAQQYQQIRIPTKFRFGIRSSHRTPPRTPPTCFPTLRLSVLTHPRPRSCQEGVTAAAKV